jgi:DNA-binding NarL/FixJ family response regulator
MKNHQTVFLPHRPSSEHQLRGDTLFPFEANRTPLNVKPAGCERISITQVHMGQLSRRQKEVLRLIADGQSNKEIGEALSLSALTVKSHLSRIGRKLGTGDRAQMVALAMRAGVIR